MKVYVASSYRNRLEAKTIMVFLRKLGHEITHDWTTDAVDPSQSPAEVEEFLQECGARDWQGLKEAEGVVLVNHSECHDSMTEFGVALGMDRLTFVLFPKRRVSVFFHQATYLVNTVEELISALRQESN